MQNKEKIMEIQRYLSYLHTAAGQLNLYAHQHYSSDNGCSDNIKQKITLISELIRIVENEIDNYDL